MNNPNEASRLSKYLKTIADEMRPKLIGILRKARIDISGWDRDSIKELRERLIMPGKKKKLAFAPA